MCLRTLCWCNRYKPHSFTFIILLKMLTKKFILPVIIIAILAALFLTLGNKAQAPNVTFTTLEGKAINMADLKGKVVLVNFWATDCPGCIAEMPELMQTYEEYKDQGFEMIAVAMPYDPPAQVVNFNKVKSLPFPVMHDGLGEMVSAFGGVNLTPTTFIYDKQGNRLKRILGQLDFSTLTPLIAAELAK